MPINKFQISYHSANNSHSCWQLFVPLCQKSPLLETAISMICYRYKNSVFFKKYPPLSNIFCSVVFIIQLVLSWNNWIIYPISLYSSLQQGCTNSECQVTLVTKFCTMVPNICRSSIRNLLHVTLRELKLLRSLLHFLTICTTQVCSTKILCAHLSKISTLLLAESIQKSTNSQYWCQEKCMI